ncbi:MAG: N-acetylmuramoyl-L-alanine amidase [Lachnospiraceae bacterium]|nr:N-acetylmuramoyl-L-alanine amidase [Lachnospiraceae bacterium]
MKKAKRVFLVCMVMLLAAVQSVSAAGSAGGTSVQETVKKKSRKDFIIAIDAGHQRKGNYRKEPIAPGSGKKKAKVSSGTQGVATGLAEYRLNLAVAKCLKKQLKQMGFQVYMVRKTHDVNIPNSKRVKMAVKAKADILIHIHANGSARRSDKGAFTICQTKKNPWQKQYKKSSALAKYVLNAYCAATSIKKRPISERDDLTGINYSPIPTIFIEMGYMTNPSEDRKMAKKANQLKMAKGIADGVEKYYKAYGRER